MQWLNLLTSMMADHYALASSVTSPFCGGVIVYMYLIGPDSYAGWTG